MRFIKQVALAALAACTSAAASAYTVTPYAVPGSASTRLWGLNDHGVLVGQDDNGGFIDDHGAITTVNLDGAPGFVAGISNGGLAVGSDGTSSFFYQGGVYTPFSIAGANYTLLRGISANGRYATGVFETAGGEDDGFVFDRVTSTLSMLVPPAGNAFTAMQGVNDDGIAVGSLNVGASVMFDTAHGTTTTFTELDGLTGVRFRAIDDAGDIGGWAHSPATGITGFLDTAAGGLTTFALDSEATYVYGLNNAGEAIGFYEDPDSTDHSFVITASAVPEPSSAASTALALLAGCALFARRRKAG